MIRSAVGAVRSYFRRDWDLETLVNVINHDHPITPEILLHLEKMYLALFWILASFEYGFHFGLTGNIVGSTLFILFRFPRIGAIGQQIRFYILITGAMFGGLLAGTCVRPFLVDDLGVKIDVFMWTFATLVLLEAARFRLYRLCDHVLLCNPLRLGLGLVFLAALILAADPYIKVCNFIMWFVGYAAVYSRLLVQRIRDGDDDIVRHAITFLTDAPAVSFHMVDLVFWGAWNKIRDVAGEGLQQLPGANAAEN